MVEDARRLRTNATCPGARPLQRPILRPMYDERGRHRSLLGMYDRAEVDRRLAQFIAEREGEMRRVDAPVTDVWEDTRGR